MGVPHPAMQAVLDRLARQRSGWPSRYGLPFAEARAQLEEERRAWRVDKPACASSERLVRHGGRTFAMRVYQPVDATPSRALVYLHGGGWCVGSSATHDNIVRRLACGLNCETWSVDYALAPEAPFPAGLLDCIAAIELAAKEHPASRLIVAGDSAGANLALDAALRLRDARRSPIAALLLFYGVFSDACNTPSMEAFGDGRYGLSLAAQQRYLDAYAGGASLPFALHDGTDLRRLPPCWLTAAELDILHDQSLVLGERMRQSQVDVMLDDVPGVTHGFLSYGAALPQANEALARAVAWAMRRDGNNPAA